MIHGQIGCIFMPCSQITVSHECTYEYLHKFFFQGIDETE